MSARAPFARAWRALALLTLGSFAAAQDGPYVMRDATGAWRALSVEIVDDAPRKREQSLTGEARITVPVVGAEPAFEVALRAPAPDARDDLTVPARSALFVVADTHGEYEIFAAQLRRHGVVDDKLAWKFGRGHLVVLGDTVDRGPRQTEILWLLYKLEAEAAKAGGGSHLVLGNHETMVLSGDRRYLNPRYLETVRVLGAGSYAELLGPDTVLGQWLRSRPTILRINDQLFLHGGISRALADSGLTIAAINSAVRELLSGNRPETATERERAELLLGSLGPLWYRGYFANQSSFPAASDEDIEFVLQKFGARRIFIGHTIVPAITPLYGGRVIAVQVYPKREDDGAVRFESLLVKSGKLWRATPERLEPLAIGHVAP